MANDSAASSSTFNNSFINNKSNSILTKHISEEWGDIDSFCNKYGFYHHQQQQTLFGPIPRFQETHEDQNCSEPSSNPLENTSRSIKEGDEFKKIDTSDEVGQKLSTEEILKLAGERFLQFSSHKFINMSILLHPHAATSLSTLSLSDKQDVELAQLLLAAADKVGNHQLDPATRLLNNCQWISSNAGTPVQRAVYYFAEALTERINKEKSSSSSNEQQRVQNYDACLKKNILAFVSLYQQLPLFQIVHFTAAQTILENIGKSSKKAVHLIDFQILTGLHWAAVIQAMSEQSRDQNSYLKITAVEASDKSGAEKAGNLLRSFAAHMNLPFSYNVVFCSDIKDLKQEDFSIEPQETVAVMFNFLLRTLISRPACLKNLMNITQKINPTIIVVSEVEANHNSPSFVNRFIEALFYYGVLFDGLAESMAGDGSSRMAIESVTFREGIRNIVACEGYERLTRSVPISVWRSFFDCFGMKEMELSPAAVYQASLIMNQSVCGKSCSLDVSTDCLLVGWKGTPLFSVSAWKFC